MIHSCSSSSNPIDYPLLKKAMHNEEIEIEKERERENKEDLENLTKSSKRVS
jgi:hypothetical protein